MLEHAEEIYLSLPDNEAIPVFTCDFCDENIYQGDTYYLFNGKKCCEDCLNYCREIAEPLDLEAEKADLEHHDTR